MDAFIHPPAIPTQLCCPVDGCQVIGWSALIANTLLLFSVREISTATSACLMYDRGVKTTPTSTELRSIFSSATVRERAENFETYWLYTLGNDGDIIEDDKDLTKKRELRARLQAKAVRARRPLSDPQSFYRN